MSICVVLMTLSYAYIRLQIMVDLDDSQHFKFEEISLEKEEFFNQTDTNFNVAFKVAKNYDWVAHEVDIEGYLVWEVTNWNWVPLFDENGVQTGQNLFPETVGIHKCNDDDLKSFYETPDEQDAERIPQFF